MERLLLKSMGKSMAHAPLASGDQPSLPESIPCQLALCGVRQVSQKEIQYFPFFYDITYPKLIFVNYVLNSLFLKIT